MSPRFEKKSEVKEWLNIIAGARNNIKLGRELTAAQRRVLEQAGLEFQTYEGDIFVDDLAARFLKWRAEHYVASTVQPNYDHLRKYILPALGKRNVYGIGPSELRRFIRGLKEKEYIGKDENGQFLYKETEKPLSESTKKRIQVTLSLLFEFAIEEELVGPSFVNPVQKGKRRGSRQASSDEKIKYWDSEEDIKRFLKVAQSSGPMFFAFVTIKLNTGARKSEMLALRYCDFDLKNKRLFIANILEQNSLTVIRRTKAGSDKTRIVPLNDFSIRALKDLEKVSDHNGPEDYVFTRKNGEPFSPRQINILFSECAKIAEVENIGPHGLRHTFATHFIKMGGRVEDLKEILGHSSITTTMKYVHLAKKNFGAKDRIVSFGLVEGAK